MLYVDPAAGSIILQVTFAALLGGALTAKRWWGSVREAVRTRLNRLRPR
jgi:hypothetical protein